MWKQVNVIKKLNKSITAFKTNIKEVQSRIVQSKAAFCKLKENCIQYPYRSLKLR